MPLSTQVPWPPSHSIRWTWSRRWVMAELRGTVAVVTGASRGVGKGVALGLGEAGATVYITGRTVHEGTGVEGLPGSLSTTADEVRRLGGQAIPVLCDHRNDG